MKNNLFAIAVLIIIIGLSACKKEVKHTTFPPPVWKEDQTGKYPVSMTAVVTMYYELNMSLMPDDQMAAFVNDECRGVGQIVKVSPISTVFFILIHGTAAEQNKIKFKYYSTKSSYMYATADFLDFKIDSNFGTADKPETLELKPVD